MTSRVSRGQFLHVFDDGGGDGGRLLGQQRMRGIVDSGERHAIGAPLIAVAGHAVGRHLSGTAWLQGYLEFFRIVVTFRDDVRTAQNIRLAMGKELLQQPREILSSCVQFSRVQSIGQSIWYGLQTNKKPGIILLMRSKEDYKYFIQLNSALTYANLNDQITVYLYPNDFQELIQARQKNQ